MPSSNYLDAGEYFNSFVDNPLPHTYDHFYLTVTEPNAQAWPGPARMRYYQPPPLPPLPPQTPQPFHQFTESPSSTSSLPHVYHPGGRGVFAFPDHFNPAHNPDFSPQQNIDPPFMATTGPHASTGTNSRSSSYSSTWRAMERPSHGGYGLPLDEPFQPTEFTSYAMGDNAPLPMLPTMNQPHQPAYLGQQWGLGTARQSFSSHTPQATSVVGRGESASERPARVKMEAETPNTRHSPKRQREVKREGPDTSSGSEEEPEHICNLCHPPKTFVRKCSLKEHLGTHGDRRKIHVCDTCFRPFKLTSDLNRHVRTVHLKLREDNCEMCGRDFPRKDSLIRHQTKSCPGRVAVNKTPPPTPNRRRNRKLSIIKHGTPASSHAPDTPFKGEYTFQTPVVLLQPKVKGVQETAHADHSLEPQSGSYFQYPDVPSYSPHNPNL